MQRTLLKPATFAGTGLHSGRPARMVVRPAPAHTGILFKRMDVPAVEAIIPALWDRVIVSPLNTRIENAFGHSVSTIEHLMAALAGCGVHNALVEIAGPEVPVLDGSSSGFVRGIMAAGLQRQGAALDVIEILQPVEVCQGDATARIEPAAGVSMDFTIEFPDEAIGYQHKSLDLSNGAFVRELCDSRTFCRRADIDAMRAAGKALGGTFDNAVVVDGAEVLSPGGLRHPDEAVRHKMLDALGDLSTAGVPILGHYVGNRAGHALTNQLLRAMFAAPDSWRLRRADAALAARLPGAGLAPADLEAVA
ncbi:UDP-3-O-acyl-N-acetylglucosamine deacetylase [Flavimaricola marinus]|uniref:UDP-3-O-acyl-N-acetylglucosamine deacetylase n=1 Tax=Flavimaricola marinus TaxID=1819565 RepID=A0A238LE95_9RHOB|nr:UDP-3-O-acyl-N-acetylglucosamine deacetylase [Flavimaricola marinus]SMY07725.1 UDP-3-O-[3-hydroxymyristoyl] N-acetylglucosamine deacetylase [Flavimaricola marinus]